MKKKILKRLENQISIKDYDNAKKEIKKYKKIIQAYENQKDIFDEKLYVQFGFELYMTGTFYGFSENGDIIIKTGHDSFVYTPVKEVHLKRNKKTMKQLAI